jgi:hypothetical protein
MAAAAHHAPVLHHGARGQAEPVPSGDLLLCHERPPSVRVDLKYPPAKSYPTRYLLWPLYSPGWDNGSFVLLEVAREGKVARLKIQLPKNSGGLTVVYSDSDAGKKQELMVATSPLKFGDAATLSHVWKVDAAKAICQMKENQLAPVSVELSPKPGKAVIETE